MASAASQGIGGSDRLHIPSLEPVRTGMPELCRAGLSENWLLKACGHRHWLALAQAHGLARPLFRDRDGARLYPAFIHLRVSDARLDHVAEDKWLDFAVTLRRTSRTRFRSEITASCDGDPIAKVAMETAFVRREGSNRNAQRAIVAGPCALMPGAPDPRPDSRIDWQGGEPLATIILDPSPHEDFNGVGFLYFAAFQAMLDRAEWQLFRRCDMVTRDREIAFLGNADPGEYIFATLRRQTGDADDQRHWMDLSRQRDGVIIGRAVTRHSRCTSRLL